jgi:transposase
VRSPNGPLEASDRVRHLYRLDDPRHARAYLRYWCTRALRSKIPEFVFLVTRLEKHFDAITAAVELGLSNSRLEGINAKIRVIQRRGYGHPDPDASPR